MTRDLFSSIVKPLQCRDCGIDTHFLAIRPTKRVFVATILERAFFLCPNCRCLSHRLVAMPAPSSGMTVNSRGIFGRSLISEAGLHSGQGVAGGPQWEASGEAPQSETTPLSASQTQ
jgi:hypothetical protein